MGFAFGYPGVGVRGGPRMREGITLSAGERGRLEAVVADRNSPQKHDGGRGSCCWRPTVWAPAGSCGRAVRAGTQGDHKMLESHRREIVVVFFEPAWLHGL